MNHSKRNVIQMHKKIMSILITVLLILTTSIAAVSAETNQEENILSQSEQSLSSTGPVADAGGSYHGVVNTPIQFDGTGSYHPNGTIISYEWFCGDGDVETGLTPDHHYLTPGTYTLTLTVKDADENCGTDTTQVIVSDDQPPEAFFQSPKEGRFYFRNKELFSTNGTTLVLGPCNVTIEANDDVEVQRVEIYIDGQRKHIDFDEPYSYNWKFGAFSHTIKAIIYDTSNHEITIEQTVFKWRLHPILMLQTISLLKGNQNQDLFSGDNQQNSPSVLLLNLLKFVLKSNQFNNQQDNDVLAQLLEKILQKNQNDFNLYQFLNNHPLISKRLQKNHKFIYNLIMLSNGDWSSNNNKDRQLSLLQNRPVLKTLATLSIIKYTYEKTQQLPSLLPSKEPTGLESFYQWIRDHPYLILFSSLLFIQLLSRLSNTYSDSDNDDFDEPTENRIPHANAGGPYNQEKGKNVMFSAGESYDEDGTIVSFEWDFGDGYTGSGETVEHQYDSTGNYIVTLTVTDEDGATSTDTVTVYISAEKTQTTNKDSEDMTFWIVSGGLSSLLLAGVAILQFRRRLFE